MDRKSWPTAAVVAEARTTTTTMAAGAPIPIPITQRWLRTEVVGEVDLALVDLERQGRPQQDPVPQHRAPEAAAEEAAKA